MSLANRLKVMRERCSDTLSEMSDSFARVAWLDFPDYSNVGDSAIWLGQLEWARATGRNSTVAVPHRAVSRRMLEKIRESGALPIVTGGGNFGGLYEAHHRARLEAFRAFEDIPIVQAPQSVYYASDEQRNELEALMESMSDLRLAVRDLESLGATSPYGAVLTPDCAHLLGPIPAPPPVRRVQVLARTDREVGSSGAVREKESVDWLAEPDAARRARQVRAVLASRTGMPSLLPSVQAYETVARRRLSRGVAILSRGEVIVTDRLHGMILALAIGRRVVAVDNAVGKLSRYATAWFDEDADGQLRWSTSIREAVHIAEGRW